MLSLQTVGNAGVEEIKFCSSFLLPDCVQQAGSNELSEKSPERMSCIIDYGLARRLQDVGKGEKCHDPGVLSEMCKGCLDTLARIMHRFLSRSDESADLSALRHARQRPPQTYCTVR